MVDLDKPYEKEMNILKTQKCGNKPLTDETDQLSLIAMENGVKCL
jgi:hypothetical protein